MTLRRSGALAAVGLMAALAFGAIRVAAQDTIARAKDLYQSAEYDEALSLLDQLKNDPSATAAPEIAVYRVFCLLALGRNEEARQSIGTIVRQNPRYQPSEAETSPRIRAVFEGERRRLLPQIFQERYERAKSSFESKEFQSAADQFTELLSLVDDPALVGEESRPDFRLLISGFVDLAQAAVSTQAPPKSAPVNGPSTAAAAPPPSVAPAAVEPPRIYSTNDPDVVPPVALSKKLPIWRPPAGGVFSEGVGMLELVIDERGDVVVAKLRKSVQPVFDAKLLQAARDWKFRPATRQGQPVSFRTFLEVKLVP